MDMQNDQGSSPNPATKAQEDAQTDTSINSNNTPKAPSTDDMELNEEQLDIISGGGDIKILTGI